MRSRHQSLRRTIVLGMLAVLAIVATGAGTVVLSGLPVAVAPGGVPAIAGPLWRALAIAAVALGSTVLVMVLFLAGVPAGAAPGLAGAEERSAPAAEPATPAAARPTRIWGLIRALARAVSADDALAAVMRHAIEYDQLPVRGAVMYVRDPSGTRLRAAAAWQLPTLDRTTELSIELSPLAVGLREQRPLLLVDSADLAILPLPPGEQPGALLALPLQADAPRGLLCLLGTLDDRHVGVARLYADCMAIVATASDLRHEVLLRERRTRLLAELTRELAGTPPLDQALAHVLQAAALIADVDHGTILVLDAQQQIARRVALDNGNLAPLELVARPVLESGLAGFALRDGQTQVVGDTLADARWVAVPGLGDIRAAVAVPIASEGRVLGVLTLAHELPGVFTPAMVELIETLAAHAALALARAETHGAAQPGDPQPALVLRIGLHGLERNGHAPALERNGHLALLYESICRALLAHTGTPVACDAAGVTALFDARQPGAAERALQAARAVADLLLTTRSGAPGGPRAELASSLGLAEGDVLLLRPAGAGMPIVLGAPLAAARRLQELARPGELLTTRAVAFQLRGIPALELTPLDPLQLGQHTAPELIYAVLLASPGRGAYQTPRLTRQGRPSS